MQKEPTRKCFLVRVRIPGTLMNILSLLSAQGGDRRCRTGSPKSLYNHVATSHIEQLSARVERLSLKSAQISETAVESSEARQLLVLFFI